KSIFLDCYEQSVGSHIQVMLLPSDKLTVTITTIERGDEYVNKEVETDQSPTIISYRNVADWDRCPRFGGQYNVLGWLQGSKFRFIRSTRFR
ncbi:MAG: hypothetical protein NTV34_08675, partial [Proteobacteria bacterium]|nr:hypothetical protein [Pseudomonadota bacterium]